MMNVKGSLFLKLAIVFALLVSGAAYSVQKSGQLTVVNSLANGITIGSTATSFTVQVSDSIGLCSIATMVVYDGNLVIKWDATKTHTYNQCTGITSVSVLPLRTIIGTTSTIIYDHVTTTPVPAGNATGSVVYTAPTTPVANLVLLVTGTGIPSSAQAASATSWGIGAAATPVFNPSNGDIVTVGVPGGVGMAGLKAELFAKKYDIAPHPEVRDSSIE